MLSWVLKWMTIPFRVCCMLFVLVQCSMVQKRGQKIPASCRQFQFVFIMRSCLVSFENDVVPPGIKENQNTMYDNVIQIRRNLKPKGSIIYWTTRSLHAPQTSKLSSCYPQSPTLNRHLIWDDVRPVKHKRRRLQMMSAGNANKFISQKSVNDNPHCKLWRSQHSTSHTQWRSPEFQITPVLKRIF